MTKMRHGPIRHVLGQPAASAQAAHAATGRLFSFSFVKFGAFRSRDHCMPIVLGTNEYQLM